MTHREFRIWDRENKKYFEPTYEAYKGRLEDLHISMSGRLCLRTIDSFIDESRFEERFIIEYFTGFADNEKIKIFEGDNLGDWIEVDGEMVQSKMQVFWCQKMGAWKLDNSFNQDKSNSYLLSNELIDFSYKVVGHIHQNPKKQ